jgi:xylulokinase
VYESHEVTGELSEWAADKLGLKKGTPVVGGSGDQPAGAVGNGIVAAGIVSATMGTSGVVFAHSRTSRCTTAGAACTRCARAVEGKWCVFGCMLSAGGSFQWFRNDAGQGGGAQGRKKKGVDPYELLINEAAKAPGGARA